MYRSSFRKIQLPQNPSFLSSRVGINNAHEPQPRLSFIYLRSEGARRTDDAAERRTDAEFAECKSAREFTPYFAPRQPNDGKRTASPRLGPGDTEETTKCKKAQACAAE
ncbi:hypothetical protein RJ55_04860 [Drechmeria coniospora]|nr:hypothetical protein RJ55_04860 [Drechmeria coniospora]